MSIEWIIDAIKQIWMLFNTPLLEISGSRISLTTVLISFVAFFLSYKLADIVSGLVSKFLNARSVDRGVKDSLTRFTRYGVITVGALISLDILGFSLSSLAAIGAVLMVGIGFGLQNISQNFISGIIILIERPIKVGDIIKVGDTSGKVVDIKVRSTIIQTRDDVSIIVPNSKIVSDEVINETFPNETIRLSICVGVSYGSDLDLVKKLLLASVNEHPDIEKSPKPVCIFYAFGESSLDFEIRFWTKELWDAERVSSDIRFKIDQLFRENDVQIPFPQMDLHLKNK